MGRRTRIFLSLYLGFATYCLLVLFFGKTGIIASSELRDYHNRLETNLAHLETINGQLSHHLDSLRSSSETIRLAARQLGYLEPNERVVQISGYAPPKNSFAVGTLVSKYKQTWTKDGVSRLIGLAVAIAAFVLTGLFARRRHGPQS